MAMFRNISDHPEDLASGRVVGPGESFGLDADEQKREHNARLIEEGKFISLAAPADEKGEATDGASGAGKKGAGK